MPVARGKKHIYVGMDLDYSTPGEMIVSMDSYITKAIDEFPEEIMKSIKTTAGNHIFKVDDACKKLCERDKIIFHRLVAKLVFLRKRAQPYIKPTISLLTKRVRNAEEDYWKNIQRVIRYLDAIINAVTFHINANDLNIFHCWVEASYGPHPDRKGQIGATISIRKG